jgi:hypothetical protein
MRSILLQTALLALPALGPAFAQAPADSVQLLAPASPTKLAAFDAERIRLDQRGLAVLGTWAAGNLLVSGIAVTQTEQSTRYFHQMNIGWGAVNLALAGAGYLGARRAARQPAEDRAGNVRAQLRTENLYLLNAGLDVAYLATGVYLLGERPQPYRLGFVGALAGIWAVVAATRRLFAAVRWDTICGAPPARAGALPFIEPDKHRARLGGGDAAIEPETAAGRSFA